VSAPVAPAGVLDAAWRVHEQVSVRPERFGALLYHFGTRRLSFLKDPRLLTVLQVLDEHGTARGACVAAGVAECELPGFGAALSSLASSQMIRPRAAS
jgi:putative mycofactocin binding protein MftB